MALIAHWKLDEASGAIVDTVGNIANINVQGSPTYSLTGIDGTAIGFGGSSNAYVAATTATGFNGIAGATVSGWIKATTNSGSNRLFNIYKSSSHNFYFDQLSDGKLKFYGNAGTTTDFVRQSDAAVDLTTGDFIHVAATIDLATQARQLYVNGEPIASTSSGSITASTFDFSGTAVNFVIGGFGAASPFIVDDVRIYSTALSDSEVLAIYAEFVNSDIAEASIPMSLNGFIVAASASLPMRLATIEESAGSSIPMRLESADPAHYLASVARWNVAVTLGGVDISDDIAGPITIEHEEMSSGICALDFHPGSGSLDPSDYERKDLRVSFVGLDSSGSVLYTVRRFTGITSTANYDPDTGIMAIDATTDLQGWLENLDREVIDDLVGGQWSGHIFDDGASGYQYTQDRLSTTPYEMHVDNYGRFETVAWAPKVTPDITLTDAGRFNNTLKLTRASRRDLITRVRINLDFRFVRLRQRIIGVHFVDSLGFCHYLHNGWVLPSKDMVRGAADGNEWVRVSEISWQELPGPGLYCTPESGWAGGADAFCLGAFWQAARRWAQTVTEEYALDVVAPDLEEAIGQQLVSEDYGIESSYDSTDFEQIKSYTSTPAGAVYSTKSADWQLDATAAEATGRAAMETAQECALAKARVLILDRARGNRLSCSPIYRPDMTLAKTVRINTPHLVATGKVAKVAETLNPTDGALSMRIELALSRHGGSGLASDDTLIAADEPEQTQEETSDRQYYFGYHLGGTSFSPADSEDWDGYMCNVTEALRDVGANLYRPRFVVRMPEIEEAARNAASVTQLAAYEVEVPQDELTMSN